MLTFGNMFAIILIVPDRKRKRGDTFETEFRKIETN